MTRAEIADLMVALDDQDLAHVMWGRAAPSTWTREDRSGTMTHSSGARVMITGAHGRWVAILPSGRMAGRSFFKHPSGAINRLRERGAFTT